MRWLRRLVRITALLGLVIFTQGSNGQEASPLSAAEVRQWGLTDLSLQFFSSRPGVCADSQVNLMGCVKALRYAGQQVKPSYDVIITSTAEIVLVLSTNADRKTPSEEAVQNVLTHRTAFQIQQMMAVAVRTLGQGMSPSPEKLAFDSINVWMNTLEPHTYLIFDPALYAAQVTSSQRVKLFGFSFQMQNGALYIRDIFAKSPAERAGLRVGDQILALNGRELSPDITLEEFNARLDATATVRFRVVSRLQKNAPQRDIIVSREEFAVQVLEKKTVQTVEPNKSLGWLKIRSFMPGDVCAITATAVADFEAQKVNGYVLDLRGNPGGAVDQALCVLGLFLGPGQNAVREVAVRNPVLRYMSVYGPSEMLGEREEWVQTRHERLTQKPLIVLVDAGTASASEITAGVLQDRGRALVVGERSFGKGSQQMILRPVWDARPHPLVSIALTTHVLQLPSGRGYQRVGITPDISLPWGVPGASTREADLYERAQVDVGAHPNKVDGERSRQLLTCLKNKNRGVTVQSEIAALMSCYLSK